MKIITYLVFSFFSTVLLSQLEHPKVSPAATLTQKIGFTTIKIAYSRPAVKGRIIFGDLVPYDRIWRVGANESTKISVDTEVEVKGHKLQMGTYALYVFPQAANWEIVFHHNTSHWGDGRNEYNHEEDAFRFKVKPHKSQSFQENLLISFDSISHNRATLAIHWAHTKVSFPITVDTHKIMQQQITERLSQDAKPQTYYEAARYYIEQGIQYDTALVYVNKAIALGGDTYFFHRVKSLAEAELGNYKAAIESAEKSMLLAEEQNKDEFVRMNRKNIDLWRGKLKN